MSHALEWDGRGPIQSVDSVRRPDDSEVLVAVGHVLCESASVAKALSAVGIVEQAGSLSGLSVGDPVVCATDQIASHLTLAAQQCLPISGVATSEALLMPPVAGVLKLMENIKADLGWTAIISGDGLIADLTAQVAGVSGARQVLRVHKEEVEAVDSTGNDVEESPDLLASKLAEASGPIVGIDTTAHPTEIQGLLSTLPVRSTCALHGGAGGGVSAINFYLDVHRKNIRILGNSASLTIQHLQRARAFVESGRLQRHDWPATSARANEVPNIPMDSAYTLEWA